MRTRRGACYSPASCQDGRRKRRRIAGGGGEGSAAAAAAVAGGAEGPANDMFEELPDDLVVSILADVAASARSPGDLAGAMLTYVCVGRKKPRKTKKSWSSDMVFVLLHMQVQAVQGARAEQGGAREGVAAVPRRAGQGVVGRCAPLPAALRRRRQPRRVLPSWHGEIELGFCRIVVVFVLAAVVLIVFFL
jgi:hypothetical protein